MPNVVVGIGFGAPFVVSGNFDTEGKTGSYAKFNATDASILVLEAAPTIGIRMNERLNIGASLGITTLKYLRLAAEFGERAGTGTVASAGLETDSDFGVPFAPTEFSTSPADVSFTLGLQYGSAVQFDPPQNLGESYIWLQSGDPKLFGAIITNARVAIKPARGKTLAFDLYTYRQGLSRAQGQLAEDGLMTLTVQ